MARCLNTVQQKNEITCQASSSKLSLSPQIFCIFQRFLVNVVFWKVSVEVVKNELLSPQSRYRMGSINAYISFQSTSNLGVRGYLQRALRLGFSAETVSKGNN